MVMVLYKNYVELNVDYTTEEPTEKTTYLQTSFPTLYPVLYPIRNNSDQNDKELILIAVFSTMSALFLFTLIFWYRNKFTKKLRTLYIKTNSYVDEEFGTQYILDDV